MDSWFTYLKRGLARELPEDPLAGRAGYFGFKANLKNLRPYFVRHWRKGLIGCGLILLNSLSSFPQPLITRYIVDDVVLARQLELLARAILLLIGMVVVGKITSLLENFYFARFEQRVTLDIQQDLAERVMSFPKAFFDNSRTGYLMSRLSSDVEGLRWFFSSTSVYIVGNVVRFAVGLGLLFYLEWRLAVIAVLVLPGIVLFMRYFSSKLHVLSHQSMEQEAKVASGFQESLASTSLIKTFSSEGRTVG